MSSRQRRLAAFAVLNLLLLVGGWFMLVSPQRTAAGVTAAQEQLVEGQLEALTGSPQGPTKQPAIHTSDLYTLGTALPSQLDQPDLLFELDRLAEGAGVKIINLAPQAPVAATTEFTIQPINLSLSGSYFQLTGFLRSLRLLVSKQHGRLIVNGPLFAVTSVSLAPGQSADETAHGEVATVAMAAYYYGQVGGAVAPAPADTTTTDTTGG